MLIGRIVVDAVTQDDPGNEGTASVYGREDAAIPPRFDRFVPQEVVARLRCRDLNHSDHHLNPEFVFADAFYSESALLELVAGGEALENLINDV